VQYSLICYYLCSSFHRLPRRNIATKCIAKKMMEGYSIIETACTDCGMPLMEANGTASCVVCPELTENLEKLQELNLTEQLRIKKSFDKQKLSEELMKKKEEERQAREFAQKEEEDARLKAIAEKTALVEATAKEERETMEKLLATLQELEAEVEGKQIDAEETKNEGTVVVPTTPGCPGGATAHETDCTQEVFEGKVELEAEVEGRLIDAETTENGRPVVVPTTSGGAPTPESDVTQEGLDKKEVAGTRKDEEPAGDRSDQKQHLEGEGLELFNEPDVMIKEKKRLEVIDVETPWLEEMKGTTQKTQKLVEQAAPGCVKTEQNSQDCTAEFRTVRDAAFLEERQKREEERRLRQEKVLKDKAAIEKAKKERIEAAKRRVEETARAEAVLMAKLQEESEAAKSAIDYAKRLSTPMGDGKQSLSYFFCSNTPEKTGNGENLEDEWEVRCKKAQASIPSRLNQGWKKTELHCQGAKCGSISLLTFRSSSPYCIVCGGCGSGTDGLYKRVTSPVSPSRSGRRKPSTPIFPKMFEFVKVQPSVTAEPTVLPLVKKLLSEGEIAEEVKSKISAEEKTVYVEEETAALNDHTKPMESVVFEKSHIMGTKEPFERTPDETFVKGDHVECTEESRHAFESKQLKYRKASEVQPEEFSASESGLTPAGIMVDFTNSQVALNVSLYQERKVVQASNKKGLTLEITNGTVKVEECRQDSNTTQIQDTRESADPPLVSIPPPHERSHSVVNGFAAPRVEILELFDLNASLTGKKEIPRTPAIARPNIFGDYGDLGDFNKYKARPASKFNSAKAVRSSTDESKLPSFDNDVALAAIMNDLSQIKLKLNTAGLETDGLSGTNEIDSLIEKLSSAALAMKNT
jgi:uncharacterized Zn finger protein (UPF0148 family)